MILVLKRQKLARQLQELFKIKIPAANRYYNITNRRFNINFPIKKTNKIR